MTSASAQSTHRLRLRIIESLGGKCAVCELDDVRMLVIDHRNGGGSRERAKARGYSYYNAMLGRLDEFQVLCWNHNHVKRLDMHEN